MTLFGRILVPLDGSPVDDAVLEHVVALADAFHSEVILLRVAHFHTRDTMTHEVEDAQAVLDRAAPRSRAGAFRCAPWSAAASRPTTRSSRPRRSAAT